MAVVDPPAVSESPEPADSPMRFCLDFAELLDARGISLRVAEARSGWGRSTISAARKGPTLPNVELVANVLSAIGEDEQSCDRWRARHERLRGGTTSPVPGPGPSRSTADAMTSDADDLDEPVVVNQSVVDPASDEDQDAVDEPAVFVLGGSAEDRDVPQDDLQDEEAASSTRAWWSRGRMMAAVAVAAVVVAAGVVIWMLVRTSGSPPAATSLERTIVVQNKVAFGPSDLQEDDSPSYLAAQPIARCANEPGCKLAGTDLGSGDTVEAVCQLQGATLTNADVRSAGVENNPNLAASALWYGIQWPDGRRGYLSEVYVAAMYRGGLQLPAC